MYPLRTTTIFLIIVGFMLATGCSGDRSPTVPDMPSRMSSSFRPSYKLFEDNGIAYDEIDLAPLLYAQDQETGAVPFGDSVEIDGLHWCIAVTVEHDTSEDEDRILYAWLSEDENGFAYGFPPAASGRFFNGKDDFDIRAAKVAAAYFKDP